MATQLGQSKPSSELYYVRGSIIVGRQGSLRRASGYVRDVCVPWRSSRIVARNREDPKGFQKVPKV